MWDAYYPLFHTQSHKKAAIFKDKSFQYYREFCIIFGKDRATGVHAESAADAVEELNMEEATDRADDDFDILGDRKSTRLNSSH